MKQLVCTYLIISDEEETMLDTIESPLAVASLSDDDTELITDSVIGVWNIT